MSEIDQSAVQAEIARRLEQYASHKGCFGPWDENCHEFPEQMSDWCFPCIVEDACKLLRASGGDAATERAAWTPVENPPAHTAQHSLALLGWHSLGGVVLAHYTPWYIGRESDMVWTAEKWSRKNGRVTHWMPLPAAPVADAIEARGDRPAGEGAK